MKKFILAILCGMPLLVMAQKPFTLNGEFKNFKAGDKIYLVYADGGTRVVDSAQVANGAFTFKGSLEEPAMANLFKDINPFGPGVDTRFLDYTSLFLEAGDIKVSTIDSLKSAKISGTPSNIDQQQLMATLKPFTDKMMAFNEEFSKLSPDQKTNQTVVGAIRDRAMKVAEEMTPIYVDFVKNNPKSYVSLTTLIQFVDDPSMAAQAASLFEGLDSEIKATKLGSMLAAKFEGEKKTAIGAMAMDFTQNDQNGKPIKLSDFKGKYVLIDFWASWCGPCRGENPNVVAAYQKYKDKNFTVLGVSLDKPNAKEAWLKAIADDHLTWTQVSDLKFWQNEVAVKYGIQSIPANFLIDPTGKIIAKGLREEALHQKLEELLGGK